MKGEDQIRGFKRLWWLILVALTGCATVSTYEPMPLDQISFRDRAVTQQERDIRVTAAVLSPAEGEALLGFDVKRKAIQPIWVQIENKAPRERWFLIRSLDPEYFSPLEVAWMGRGRYTRAARKALAETIYEMQIPLRIQANATTSGFVFANQVLGARQVFVQVLDPEDGVLEFDFWMPVPGLKTDYMQVDADDLYENDVDLDVEGFRQWIGEQPCCVTNAKGTKFGDPLNLVVVGSSRTVWPAFTRAGWNVTEVMSASAVWRTIKSSLFGRRYLHSPVSALYVYGRPQDIALQKARGTVDERNHLRLWIAPITFEGRSVFIGQISRDIGIRFTFKSPTISTHKIDPDVDETRAYLLMDLVAVKGVEWFAFEEGVGESTIDEPRGNLTDDIYVTDGLRLVLFMSEERVTADRLQFIEWESPPID